MDHSSWFFVSIPPLWLVSLVYGRNVCVRLCDMFTSFVFSLRLCRVRYITAAAFGSAIFTLSTAYGETYHTQCLIQRSSYFSGSASFCGTWPPLYHRLVQCVNMIYFYLHNSAILHEKRMFEFKLLKYWIPNCSIIHVIGKISFFIFIEVNRDLSICMDFRRRIEFSIFNVHFKNSDTYSSTHLHQARIYTQIYSHYTEHY